MSSSVVGVTHVVLYAAGVPVQAERMGQMDVGPQLGQHVGRPVPATGRLEDDLGVLAGCRDDPGQVDRVVVDADGLEPLALLVSPHDQRTTLVQIDCHILSHGVSLH